jgi:hypothetical protein
VMVSGILAVRVRARSGMGRQSLAERDALTLGARPDPKEESI